MSVVSDASRGARVAGVAQVEWIRRAGSSSQEVNKAPPVTSFVVLQATVSIRIAGNSEARRQ
jgi:hypothetical protein